MAEKSTVKVVIDGKIITLTGYESEDYLQQVAQFINRKIAELEALPGYRRQRTEDRALLLELNLADEYFKAKSQAEMLEESGTAKDEENYKIKQDLVAAQIRIEKLEQQLARLSEKKNY